MSIKISPFQIEDYLETDEDIRDFLIETASYNNPDSLVNALRIAAKAKGMTAVADQAGVTRASLYKSLAKGANPRFETIIKLVETFGCQVTVQAKPAA